MAQQRTAEAGPQRATGGGDRLPGVAPNPRARVTSRPADRSTPGGLHQVALETVGEGGGQGVVPVELGEPVALRAREAVADLGKRGGGVQRGVDRLGIVAVGGVGGGDGVRRHQPKGRGRSRALTGCVAGLPGLWHASPADQADPGDGIAVRILIRILVNAAALAVAAGLVDGITIGQGTTGERVLALLGVAVVFGLVNTIIRPIVRLFTLPLFVLTLGLFTFVVNALMLLLTSWLTGLVDLPFEVDGFGAALLGALIVSVASFLLNVVLPEKYER